MKKKIIGCAFVSLVLISLAIALPIVFLVKPSGQTQDNINNNTYSNISNYTTQYPSSTSTFIIPSNTMSTPCMTHTPIPTPEYKKPWWHFW